jgi:hypothetical protein
MRARLRAHTHGTIDVEMTTETSADRAALWLPLLQRLTSSCSDCAVAGDFEEGFAGVGDIDLIAPEKSWTRIETEFRSWAADRQLQPVVVCTHRPDLLTLLAVGEGAIFFEMEIRSRRYFRFAKFFEAGDLAYLIEMDDRGFQRLRPGAIGLLRMIPSGVSWSGKLKLNPELAQRKFELMKQDPQGVVVTARLFGIARGLVVKAAQSAARGDWDRKSLILLQVWAFLRAITRPRAFIERIRVRLLEKHCEVSKTLSRDSRRVPADLEGWVTRVSEDHPVYFSRDRSSSRGQTKAAPREPR